jgi:hypothetical protein
LNNETCWNCFIIIQVYNIDHIHPSSLPSPCTLPPHWLPPPNNLFCVFILHFFKCTLIVYRGFAVVFHTWIYCTLTRLTSFVTDLLCHCLCPHCSAAFWAILLRCLHHRCGVLDSTHSYFKAALLRYNFYTIRLTHYKFTVKWFLVNLQCYAAINPI